MVGICFGHQVMAQALGGKVEKSAKGWGAGLQRYDVVRDEPWMDDVAAIAVPASHQDQVVIQPPEHEVARRVRFHAVRRRWPGLIAQRSHSSSIRNFRRNSPRR